MDTKKMSQTILNSVLIDFRIDAVDGPKPAVLDTYCRKYPQYAHELTDYAVQWLIGDTIAAMDAGDEIVQNASSPLVSRAISRFYERIGENSSTNDGATPLSLQQVSNPFDGLLLTRIRSIRDALRINTPLLAKFRNRLIDPDTVPRGFLEHFAQLLNHTLEEFLNYLRLPAMIHAAADFKAKGKPSITDHKESFEDAVRGSSLDEKQKQALLRG